MKVEAAFEHAQGLLMKAKVVSVEEKVCFGLLSKKHALELEISMSQKALENVIKQKKPYKLMQPMTFRQN